MALALDQFVRRLAESGLLTEADVQAFVDSLTEGQRPQDAQQLARLLVKAKKLTAYQAQEVYKGAGKGLVLGNYVILDKLGEGGMGMVLKARHKRMERVVALKVLSPKVTQDAAAVQRFQREVVAAARLMHPNIVAAHDADEAKGTHFLVMEYVEGKDLSAMVKGEGALSVAQAVTCIIQAARGLEFAHQQGVVHRDIKPSNLLLDNTGNVKVLDMGLARVDSAGAQQAELTASGAVIGTVDYMSPEQAEDTKRADARSDIYSLGVSLWYLLAARPLYERDSLMSKLIAHREAPIPSLVELRSDVPPTVEAVFHKMAAKRPDDRYQTMTEVISALEESLLDASSSSSMVSPGGSSEDSKLSEFLRHQKSISQPGGLPLPATKPSAVAQALASKTTVSPDVTIALSAGVGDTDSKSAISQSVAVEPRQTPAAGNSKSMTRGASKQPPLLLIGSGMGVGMAILVLGVVLLWPTSNGTVSLEINDPEIEVRLDKNGAKITGSGKQIIKIKAGIHGLTVRHGKLEFTTDKFELKKGDTVTLKVELLPGKVQVTQNGRTLGSMGLAKGDSDKPGMRTAAPQATGYALQFLKWGERVDITSLKLNPSDSHTVEAFVIPAADIVPEGGFAHIVKVSKQLILQTNKENRCAFHAELLQDDGKPRLFSTPISAPSQTLSKGRRTHVAGVQTAGETRLYIDGKLASTLKLTGRQLSEPVSGTSIGGGSGIGSFEGGIDEVRISKIARYTKDFVPESYFMPDKETLALYHCDEGSGDVVKDSSGNSHHGKLLGTKKWVKTVEGVKRPPNPDRPKPFVVIHEDKSTAEFKTLWEAFESTRPNDVIEIHGHGPFALSNCQVKQSITIRAAAGFRPRLIGEAGQNHAHCQVLGKSLSCEGCDFVRTLFSGSSDDWNFVNCRFFSDGSIFDFAGKRLHVENSLVYYTGPHSALFFRLSNDMEASFGNSVWVSSGGGSSFRPLDNAVLRISLDNNTCFGNSFYFQGNADGTQPTVQVKARNNVFAAPYRVALGLATAKEQFSWEGDCNLYPPNAVLGMGNVPLTWNAWSKEGGARDMNAVVGMPILKWNAALASPEHDPNKPALEAAAKLINDPRLPFERWDAVLRDGALWSLTDKSAGYRAGAGGKDLGVDVGKLSGANWNGTPSQPADDHSLAFSGKGMVVVKTLALPRSGPFTLEGYFTPLQQKGPAYPLGTRNQYVLVIRNSPTLPWNIIATPDGKKELLHIGNNNSVVTVPGQTRHVAGVWTGAESRIFVDGRRVGRESHGILAIPNASDNFSIGSALNGLIDEVRVSNAARYNEDFTPRLRFENDKDTLALYHCDEGSGEVLMDSSGNNHHGAIVGATWVRSGSDKQSQ